MDIKEFGSLENLMNMTKYMGELYDSDITVTVSNKDTFLSAVPGRKLNLNIKRGDKIPQIGSPLNKAIEENRVTRGIVAKQVYGIAFKSISMPITENGRLVGAITLARSLEKETKFEEMSGNLASTIEEITATMDEITFKAQNLADENEKLINKSFAAKENIMKTNDIINYIKKISEKTNMLGLNASIEAARVGEYGRGFSVVANEISKLSDATKKALGEINQILETIRNSTNEIIEEVKINNTNIENQVMSIQDIEKAVQGINNTAQELAEFANIDI